MSDRAAPPALPLNEAQSRHVAVALDRLAEVLDEVGHSTAFDGPSRSAFAPLVHALQADQSALRARLPFGVEAPDDARMLAARLGHALVLLQDAGSRGLGGFGTVDPAVPLALDPPLERLALGLVRLLDALTRRPPEPGSAPA